MCTEHDSLCFFNIFQVHSTFIQMNVVYLFVPFPKTSKMVTSLLVANFVIIHGIALINHKLFSLNKCMGELHICKNASVYTFGPNILEDSITIVMD